MRICSHQTSYEWLGLCEDCQIAKLVASSEQAGRIVECTKPSPRAMAAVAQFECPVAQELQTQAEKLWTTRVEIRLGIDPIVS